MEDIWEYVMEKYMFTKIELMMNFLRKLHSKCF
jgi:hypothetical protein